MKILLMTLALAASVIAADYGHMSTIERWYTPEMAKNGQKVYAKSCASCHGLKGEGSVSPWNIKMANGRYPPPPLNDDAHAWHHPLDALRFIVMNGGKPTGGVMPAFKNTFNEDQVDEVIAYFQDFWSDTVYEEWIRRGGLKP